jgi:hypothetical protein
VLVGRSTQKDQRIKMKSTLGALAAAALILAPVQADAQSVSAVLGVHSADYYRGGVRVDDRVLKGGMALYYGLPMHTILRMSADLVLNPLHDDQARDIALEALEVSGTWSFFLHRAMIELGVQHTNLPGGLGTSYRSPDMPAALTEAVGSVHWVGGIWPALTLAAELDDGPGQYGQVSITPPLYKFGSGSMFMEAEVGARRESWQGRVVPTHALLGGRANVFIGPLVVSPRAAAIMPWSERDRWHGLARLPLAQVSLSFLF